MLLGTGEVATPMARYHLKKMHVAEDGGTAFPKGKLKRLVSKRTGGKKVAREESAETSSIQRSEPAYATVGGQRQ